MKYTIYLDFDGTVVEHEWPKMGRMNFGAIEVIKKLQDAGHIIILNTYRVEISEKDLNDALLILSNDIAWRFTKVRDDNFQFQSITDYTKEKINPSNWDWDNMKASKVMYIDDWAPRIPLKKAVMGDGDMVDWDALDKEFEERGLYLKTVE